MKRLKEMVVIVQSGYNTKDGGKRGGRKPQLFNFLIILIGIDSIGLLVEMY